MRTYKNNNLVLMMLLLFVGQVVSAPLLSCSVTKLDSHSVSSMDMAINLSHDMSLMVADNLSHSLDDMDCCPDDCDCPSGMCSSITFYLDQTSEINFNASSDRVEITKQVVKKHTLSSIYRPPIFS